MVHRLIARIRVRMDALPADWVKAEAWLPAPAARQVLVLSTMLRAAYELPAGADEQALQEIAVAPEPIR